MKIIFVILANKKTHLINSNGYRVPAYSTRVTARNRCTTECRYNCSSKQNSNPISLHCCRNEKWKNAYFFSAEFNASFNRFSESIMCIIGVARPTNRINKLTNPTDWIGRNSEFSVLYVCKWMFFKFLTEWMNLYCSNNVGESFYSENVSWSSEKYQKNVRTVRSRFRRVRRTTREHFALIFFSIE